MQDTLNEASIPKAPPIMWFYNYRDNWADGGDAVLILQTKVFQVCPALFSGTKIYEQAKLSL